jgi:hypothetical protein
VYPFSNSESVSPAQGGPLWGARGPRRGVHAHARVDCQGLATTAGQTVASEQGREQGAWGADRDGVDLAAVDLEDLHDEDLVQSVACQTRSIVRHAHVR